MAKKRIFIVFFLLMFYRNNFGQQITFQLFIRNQCDSSIEKFGFYSLKNDTNSFRPTDTTYNCYLKDTGIYRLSFFGEERRYYFDDPNGKYIDTLNFPKIEGCYKLHVFSGYCCCRLKCEGNVVDYYTNGNKRAEGKFKDGKAIGTIYYYYSDGRLQKKLKYNRKGKKIKEDNYTDKKEAVSKVI